MAIDTEIQETLKNHTRIKNVRRGGSPEPSCQLPTAPAHTYLIPLKTKYAGTGYADSREWRSVTVRYWDTIKYLMPIM